MLGKYVSTYLNEQNVKKHLDKVKILDDFETSKRCTGCQPDYNENIAFNHDLQ